MDILEAHKGAEIVLLDLRPDFVHDPQTLTPPSSDPTVIMEGRVTIDPVADFFVICNGTSDRQLKALTEHVRGEVKEAHPGHLPFSIEGEADCGWVLMDYGGVIVHLFLSETRRYYDLEGLWRSESRVMLSIQ